MKRLSIIALLALTACHAPDKTATKSPVVGVPLQSFALAGESANQDFFNNKFFFWRTPLDPELSEKIQVLGKEIDRTEDKGVEARNKFDELNAGRVATAAAAFQAAVDQLTADADKQIWGAYLATTNELSGSFTDDEMRDGLKKQDNVITKAQSRLAGASAGLSVDVRQKLNQWVDASRKLAQLPDGDDGRGPLLDQIDALNRQLGELPAPVSKVKTELRDLFGTYATSLGDRAHRAELEKQIAEMRKAMPAETEAFHAVRVALDDAFAARATQLRVKNAIAAKGEAMVDFIIANTDYFENMLESVTFRIHGGTADIYINGFPEKDRKLSTEDGSIRNVTYESQGGVLRFEAHPVPGAPYYKFKLSRSRLDRLARGDKRNFYQGDMDLCLPNTDCNTKSGNLLRHGVAKLATSN